MSYFHATCQKLTKFANSGSLSTTDVERKRKVIPRLTFTSDEDDEEENVYKPPSPKKSYF